MPDARVTKSMIVGFKMKMMKSLLLGSAAGLVAIAGAQAADLPVKAKPVQYVKICSLYRVGFYYIPGTDMCIKIGGWCAPRQRQHHMGLGEREQKRSHDQQQHVAVAWLHHGRCA